MIRQLNMPTAIDVRCGQRGEPRSIRTGRPRPSWRAVADVVERWRIDDLWWTDEPVRRSYFLCQLEGGALVTILYDERREAWYVQR